MSQRSIAVSEAVDARFHAVYLLASEDPRCPGAAYVGYTVNPERRLEQHNGGKQGGANATKRRGRPWKLLLCVHGFPSHRYALKFEFAWQHPSKIDTIKSRFHATNLQLLRSSLLHARMRHSSSVQVCIALLHILLQTAPFNELPLTLHVFDPPVVSGIHQAVSKSVKQVHGILRHAFECDPGAPSHNDMVCLVHDAGVRGGGGQHQASHLKLEIDKTFETINRHRKLLTPCLADGALDDENDSDDWQEPESSDGDRSVGASCSDGGSSLALGSQNKSTQDIAGYESAGHSSSTSVVSQHSSLSSSHHNRGGVSGRSTQRILDGKSADCLSEVSETVAPSGKRLRSESQASRAGSYSSTTTTTTTNYDLRNKNNKNINNNNSYDNDNSCAAKLQKSKFSAPRFKLCMLCGLRVFPGKEMRCVSFPQCPLVTHITCLAEWMRYFGGDSNNLGNNTHDYNNTICNQEDNYREHSKCAGAVEGVGTAQNRSLDKPECNLAQRARTIIPVGACPCPCCPSTLTWGQLVQCFKQRARLMADKSRANRQREMENERQQLLATVNATLAEVSAKHAGKPTHAKESVKRKNLPFQPQSQPQEAPRAKGKTKPQSVAPCGSSNEQGVRQLQQDDGEDWLGLGLLK